jgi:septal ring factor EnvC (AmiA/AmiB activator)
VFEVQQGLRSEIASLKAQLRKEEKERRSLETQVQRLEKLPSQVAELKRESDRATELADAATLAADEMKNRMLALQKEKEQAEELLAVEVGEKNRYRNMSVQNHEAVRSLTHLGATGDSHSIHRASGPARSSTLPGRTCKS